MKLRPQQKTTPSNPSASSFGFPPPDGTLNGPPRIDQARRRPRRTPAPPSPPPPPLASQCSIFVVDREPPPPPPRPRAALRAAPPGPRTPPRRLRPPRVEPPSSPPARCVCVECVGAQFDLVFFLIMCVNGVRSFCGLRVDPNSDPFGGFMFYVIV